MKFCKRLKDTGYCDKLKSFVNLDDENDDIIYKVPRKCIYKVNNFKIVSVKKTKQFKLQHECPFFQPEIELENRLIVLGELVFNKRDYFLIEDDDNYVIIKNE